MPPSLASGARDPTATVERYWTELMDGGEIVAARPGFSLAINAALDVSRRAMIFDGGEGRVSAAISPAVARDLRAKLGLGALDAIASPDALREALQGAGIALHDPDLIFYFAAPCPPPAAARQAPVRRLTPADAAMFADFLRQAPAQDQEEASVALDHWGAFGTFEQDQLVSVASAYPWGGSAIVDIGVLTLPHARGRGHARRLVHALARHAQTDGYQMQYRCQQGNRASAALARAAGMSRLGAWEVARSEPDDDDVAKP